MNNEEKILAILEKHGEMLEKIDQRMDRMEEHIDQIDDRSQRTAVLLEADIAPKLQLLYEGHGLIMESLDKLATKDRVEKLEDEIIVLKTAFKAMNQRITELEKAQ
ncbi:hypothetical protein AALA83_11055 [Oscillospiraceae bacterium 44-5]